MARATMADLIQELRALTDTAENQVVIGGTSYWTDDQLQDILDRHKSFVVDVALVPAPGYVSGTRVTTDYYIPVDIQSRYMETDLTVVDSLGNTPEIGYTADLPGQRIVFDSDTDGTAYYLRGTVYGMRACAAEVWQQKAAQRAALINWKAGGQTLNEDQEYQHCVEMYKLYGGFVALKTARLTKVGYYSGA